MKRLLAPLVLGVASAHFAAAADIVWPFDQPRNVAVITLKQVATRKAPILLVTHDASDHGWQFLNPNIAVIESNAAVVSLEQITKLDPSIIELADLPPGWSAHRTKIGDKWVREKLPIQVRP